MQLDYHSLNALLSIPMADGKINFEADKEAARTYFLEHVNKNTVFFHSLEEKIDYLIENEYYEKEFLNLYDFSFVKELFKKIYGVKFRFPTFMGAFKFYTQYAMKTFDGTRIIERYEDRITITALYLAQGDTELAEDIAFAIVRGEYQPATPTFLNSGKKQRGELVSCFLGRVEDNRESISRAINAALQLSARGGGVAFCLTNIREFGAPIKKIEGQASGVVPIMKIMEDMFSYANQLGARQGAGAVYLNVHHPDILAFLDTKRENADEKVRIKTLSLGLVVPDITFELAKRGEDMYLFSPYDVERVYGKAMSDISITENYHDMVRNPDIRKSSISARRLFQIIAEIQFESGYPYLMFEDTVNKANPIEGRINMSNLCVAGDTKILTDKGYRTVIDLYQSQEDFKVVVDNRAKNLDFSNNTISIQPSTKMFKTAENAKLYKVTTQEGFEIRATEWHKFFVERNKTVLKIPLKELSVGDKLLVQPEEGTFGDIHNPELAYVLGGIAADGSFLENLTSSGNITKNVRVNLYGEKEQFIPRYEKSIAKVLKNREDLVERQSVLEPIFTKNESSLNRSQLHSAPLRKLFEENGVNDKLQIPEFVWKGTKQTQIAYLEGMYQLESALIINKAGNTPSIEVSSIDLEHLKNIQKLLLNLGVFSRIYISKKEDGPALLPDGKGGLKEYMQKKSWSLRVTGKVDGSKLYNLLSWRTSQKEKYENAKIDLENRFYSTHKNRATIYSITEDGVEDVYDVTVSNGNSLIFNGITTSNCSEILQVNTPSTYKDNLDYETIGKDISCNLGSLNIFNAMASKDLGKLVSTSIKALTAVSEMSSLDCVPSIKKANEDGHAIGLGQMNLHGYLAANRIHYGSEEAIDFTNIYFYTVLYHALKTSNELAILRGKSFEGFEKSSYASGDYFTKYVYEAWEPKTERVKELFKGIKIPNQEDWSDLKDSVMSYGLYNQNLQAVPPTGSISYINNSTSSIHPIVDKIEVRKEGKIGRVYYPAPHLTNDNEEYFRDAYEIGPEKIIDTYAAASQHIDQGLSCTLFFPDKQPNGEKTSTKDINKAQIYAWKKGLKTLYYIRIKKSTIDESSPIILTEAECESCVL